MRCWPLHNQSKDPPIEEVESSENKPCLTKMMTLPLAWMAPGERIPDREWVRLRWQSKESRDAEKEDELRLDFLDTDKVNKMRGKKV